MKIPDYIADVRHPCHYFESPKKVIVNKMTIAIVSREKLIISKFLNKS